MSKDRAFAVRAKSLGTLGELFAIKALVDCGFSGIRNLNDHQRNFPYADLFAERDGKRMVISVKCRNKFTLDGKLNSRYNLGACAYEHAKKAEKQFEAEAHWMAISFTRDTYSVYLGSLEALGGNLGIPMTPSACSQYQCLVRDCRHGLDLTPYFNR